MDHSRSLLHCGMVLLRMALGANHDRSATRAPAREMALSSRLERGYLRSRPRRPPCAASRLAVDRQARKCAQRHDRFHCRTHRAAKRGVQHPDRELLNPHGGSQTTLCNHRTALKSIFACNRYRSISLWTSDDEQRDCLTYWVVCTTRFSTI